MKDKNKKFFKSKAFWLGVGAIASGAVTIVTTKDVVHGSQLIISGVLIIASRGKSQGLTT